MSNTKIHESREKMQEIKKEEKLKGRDNGNLTLIKVYQWNPVNADTKGTCHSVRIIRVSVFSGASDKTSGTHILSI